MIEYVLNDDECIGIIIGLIIGIPFSISFYCLIWDIIKPIEIQKFDL